VITLQSDGIYAELLTALLGKVKVIQPRTGHEGPRGTRGIALLVL
jgi:hypothetical protein